MTYVPPEKKQKGGSAGFGDFIYMVAFYAIEISFIFLGIPILMLAIGVIPLAMYLVITKGAGGEIQWIFYLFGVTMVFFQILGLQYFFRKWILQPNGLTFGEWLRWKFDPTEIRKRRQERYDRSRKMDEWYGGMSRIKEQNERLKEEQALDFRSQWYGENGDPEVLNFEIEQESDFTITLGGDFEISDKSIESEAKQDVIEIENEYSFELAQREKENKEDEEKEEETYTY